MPAITQAITSRLTPRNIVFLMCAAVMATLFTRLGFWQLSRLAERRARNALVIQRLAQPPVALAALPRDTAVAHLRRVVLDGRYDYAHEMAWTNLSHDGSPGVHLLTPLRRAGTDTAVLVDRGWVYAPDGMTVDRARWREADTVSGIGRVQEIGRPFAEPATRVGHPDEIRWLSPDSVGRWAGYPVAPFYVALDGDTSIAKPVRTPAPALDEGPHLDYAIQWFSFAAIAIFGTIVAVFREPPRVIDALN
ncbi:MAG TPA: SURF1 family protein [Gemmatimonadaceae bacterium]|jgi:surfeit locus 1 family protein|nr:SURF1 family protein [Gemmatimonadaceae bacterium]